MVEIKSLVRRLASSDASRDSDEPGPVITGFVGSEIEVSLSAGQWERVLEVVKNGDTIVRHYQQQGDDLYLEVVAIAQQPFISRRRSPVDSLLHRALGTVRHIVFREYNRDAMTPFTKEQVWLSLLFAHYLRLNQRDTLALAKSLQSPRPPSASVPSSSSGSASTDRPWCGVRGIGFFEAHTFPPGSVQDSAQQLLPWMKGKHRDALPEDLLRQVTGPIRDIKLHESTSYPDRQSGAQTGLLFFQTRDAPDSETVRAKKVEKELRGRLLQLSPGFFLKVPLTEEDELYDGENEVTLRVLVEIPQSWSSRAQGWGAHLMHTPLCFVLCETRLQQQVKKALLLQLKDQLDLPLDDKDLDSEELFVSGPAILAQTDSWAGDLIHQVNNLFTKKFVNARKIQVRQCLEKGAESSALLVCRASSHGIYRALVQLIRLFLALESESQQYPPPRKFVHIRIVLEVVSISDVPLDCRVLAQDIAAPKTVIFTTDADRISRHAEDIAGLAKITSNPVYALIGSSSGARLRWDNLQGDEASREAQRQAIACKSSYLSSIKYLKLIRLVI